MQNKRRRNKASKFIPNLHRILSDKESGAQWREDGKSFVLNDISKLISNSLLKYFRHSNISSFIRQLNLYGFKKLVGEDVQQNTYYHEKFKKNYITQLKPIRSFYNQQKYGRLKKTGNTEFQQPSLSNNQSNPSQDFVNKTHGSSDSQSETNLKQKIGMLQAQNQRLRAVEQDHLRLLNALSLSQKPFSIYSHVYEHQNTVFQNFPIVPKECTCSFNQGLTNYGYSMGNEGESHNLMYQYMGNNFYMAYQGGL